MEDQRVACWLLLAKIWEKTGIWRTSNTVYCWRNLFLLRSSLCVGNSWMSQRAWFLCWWDVCVPYNSFGEQVISLSTVMVLRHFFIIPLVKLEEICLHVLTTPLLYSVHPHHSPTIYNTHPPVQIYTSLCSFITSQKHLVCWILTVLEKFLAHLHNLTYYSCISLCNFPFASATLGSLLLLEHARHSCSSPWTAFLQGSHIAHFLTTSRSLTKYHLLREALWQSY